MASFSYRVAPSSPLVGGGTALCRVASAPVVGSLTDRGQQWREVSDADSGVCVDRDSTVGSNGVVLWEELDGSGSGEGHRFSPSDLSQPSWCDCCGDLLWSDAVACRYCSYTCHQRCRDVVTLDCPSDTSSDLDLSEVTDPNQDEDLIEVQTLVRCDSAAVAEVRGTDAAIKAGMIEKFNATSQGLYMTLSERERRLSIVSINDDGSEDLVVRDIEWSDDGQPSFHGFVRVHMNLFRPIKYRGPARGRRPSTTCCSPEQTLERTLASF
ncbi:uncharacterized protein LOC119091438 [Pollicipes pollicipes]|uniref:uncharacterized protein LOC119091438 n=1 Tax=Pollicipes pollicipes TaxID=41117 RepID=UPI0018855FCB|nr:uncharacterized protein LOC119091438 [Pollicipes pollicipes]